MELRLINTFASTEFLRPSLHYPAWGKYLNSEAGTHIVSSGLDELVEAIYEMLDACWKSWRRPFGILGSHFRRGGWVLAARAWAAFMLSPLRWLTIIGALCVSAAVWSGEIMQKLAWLAVFMEVALGVPLRACRHVGHVLKYLGKCLIQS